MRQSLAVIALMVSGLCDLPSQSIPPLEGFIENKGQWGERPFTYVGQIGPYSVGFEARGWILSVSDKSPAGSFQGNQAINPLAKSIEDAGQRRWATIRMRFTGNDSVPDQEADGRLPGRRNFFLGSDPTRWMVGLPAWRQIRFLGMYPGVDVLARHNGKTLEYDLFVSRGAALDQIEVEVEGATGLRLEKDGSLVIDTDLGPIHQPPPKTWYYSGGDLLETPCFYEIRGENSFGFFIPSRRFDLALVIDPELVFSTFLGGDGLHYATGPEVDDLGYIYVAGHTTAFNFPVTPGSYQCSKKGIGSVSHHDTFVACVDPQGTFLRYATYVGGDDDDQCQALHLCKTGVVTIIGDSKSSDFPITPGAYVAPPLARGYLTQLDRNGSALVFSSRFGGSTIFPLTFDKAADGGWVIGGWTGSHGCLPTPGVFDPVPGWPRKGFLCKISDDGSTLIFFTFYGAISGEGNTAVSRVRVAKNGNIYFSANHNGARFPMTPDSLWPSWNYSLTAANPPRVQSPGILGIANQDATKLIYSTVLAQELPKGFWCVNSYGPVDFSFSPDSQDSLLIVGDVTRNFPASSSAFDSTGFFHRSSPYYPYTGGAFKVHLPSRAIKAATFVGLGPGRVGYDRSGDIVVICANMANPDQFVTPNAVFPDWPRLSLYPSVASPTMWIGRFSKCLEVLHYSTYLGGTTHWDVPTGFCLTKNNDLIISGFTDSSDFPTTPGALNRQYWSGFRAAKGFLVRMPLESPGVKRVGRHVSNCLGAPAIYVKRDPIAGESKFGIECWKAPPSTVGFLLIGPGVLNDPVLHLFGGAPIWVDIFQPNFFLPLFFAADKDGRSEISLPLPFGTRGLTFAAQYVWLNTPACPGPGAWSSSAALEVQVQ